MKKQVDHAKPFTCRHGTAHARDDMRSVFWRYGRVHRQLRPGACWFKLLASDASAAEAETDEVSGYQQRRRDPSKPRPQWMMGRDGWHS